MPWWLPFAVYGAIVLLLCVWVYAVDLYDRLPWSKAYKRRRGRDA